MSPKQQVFMDLNSEYLHIAPMYCPIRFNWSSVEYFKKYGLRDFAACAVDGFYVLWNDTSQHLETLEKYPETEDNRPL